MADETLGMALSLWLIEQRPALRNADPNACAESIVALSCVLGAQLATVIVKSPDQYRAVLHQTMMEVDEIARDIAKRAGARDVSMADASYRDRTGCDSDAGAAICVGVSPDETRVEDEAAAELAA